MSTVFNSTAKGFVDRIFEKDVFKPFKRDLSDGSSVAIKLHRYPSSCLEFYLELRNPPTMPLGWMTSPLGYNSIESAIEIYNRFNSYSEFKEYFTGVEMALRKKSS